MQREWKKKMRKKNKEEEKREVSEDGKALPFEEVAHRVVTKL